MSHLHLTQTLLPQSLTCADHNVSFAGVLEDCIKCPRLRIYELVKQLCTNQEVHYPVPLRPGHTERVTVLRRIFAIPQNRVKNTSGVATT